MNNAELIKTIAKSTNVTQATVKSILEALQDIVKSELKESEKFELKDVGTFKVIETAARSGRNPKTGEQIQIEAGKRVKFKASKVLKEGVV